MTLLEPPAELIGLPEQPRGVPWPTREWPRGPLPGHVDAATLEALLDRAFGGNPDPGFGESYATLVIHRGQLVVERYGPGISATTPLLSWSMAKSVTHALVGILIGQGRLDASAGISEWSEPTDPRSRIRLDHLLHMTDGLEFNETYTIEDGDQVAWSHCIDMLFGTGRNAPAEYALARPAIHEPGAVFNYSSGTSNVVAHLVCDLIGRGDEAAAWMREHLFSPIGMTSATPGFDEHGDFVGSSYLHATAQDWARFGLLYLRGGVWDGTAILPDGWVDGARTTRARDEDGHFYGSHWWTAEDGRGRFHASGFEWQRVACVPTSDLVVVRLGKTPQENYDTPRLWFEELIAQFDD